MKKIPIRKETASPLRKIIQISATTINDLPCLYALCNDGTVWIGRSNSWIALPKIPQGR